MLIDLTVEITKFTNKEALENEKMVSFGHLGTHFDVMNKTFPLDYIKRDGIVFDVSGVRGRDVDREDIDLLKVYRDMFVGLYSGFIEEESYGTKRYFSEHPQLADQLIETLLEKKISIIGIDFAGIRRGEEHTPKDQYCADRGVFIVENLCNLKEILMGGNFAYFTANTYPIKFTGLSGLPCRVVGEM